MPGCCVTPCARPDHEDRVAWRGGQRHVARLVPRSVAPAGDDAAAPRDHRARHAGEPQAAESVARERPGPGQVEIRVHATGLNFRDVLNALGMYPGDPGPLGNECSGVVTAVGEGVHDLQVGDDVLAMVDRSFATWVIAPAALTVRKPPTLTHVEAATIPVTFLTAQYALHDLAPDQEGRSRPDPRDHRRRRHGGTADRAARRRRGVRHRRFAGETRAGLGARRASRRRFAFALVCAPT